MAKKRYSLVGQDGNVFFLMGYTSNAMKETGFTRKEIDEVMEDARSSDYYHAVYVLAKAIENCNSRL